MPLWSEVLAILNEEPLFLENEEIKIAYGGFTIERK